MDNPNTDGLLGGTNEGEDGMAQVMYGFKHMGFGGRGQRKGRRRGKVPVRERTVEDYIEEVEDRRAKLEASTFYTELKDASFERMRERKADEILCYGLGPISTSRIAQWQLALLLILREELKLQKAITRLYDPAFTEMDGDIIKHFGMELIEENEGGKRLLSDSTLVYMPHCDRVLYNAMLESNWSVEGLGRMTLIGNRLDMYADSIPASRLSKQCPSLYRLTTAKTEIVEYMDFPSGKSLGEMDVFNDMAVHFIQPTKVAVGDDAFWKVEEAPDATEVHC